MSRYKSTIVEEKEETLKDLIRVARLISDEINPLQARLNMIQNDIISIMEELKIDNFEGVKLIDDSVTLIELNKLNDKKSVIKYVIGTVDENLTIKEMYKNHVDYTVAKKLIKEAIAHAILYKKENKKIRL